MNCPQCHKHIPIEGAIACPFCAASLVLSAEEIAKILELTGQESEAEKISAYQKKRLELTQLVQNAPNQILKERYQAKLLEVEKAGQTLQGQAGATVKSDFLNLPSAGSPQTFSPATQNINLPSSIISNVSQPPPLPSGVDAAYTQRSGSNSTIQNNYSNNQVKRSGSGRQSILLIGAAILLVGGLLGYAYREAIVGLFVKRPNLIIRSSPSGAEVVENGERIGKTPLEITRKSDAKKQYSFTLGAPHYVTKKLEHIILDDETVLKPKELDVYLESSENRDNVSISSNPPGAAVYVDGTETGKATPLRLHLDDGVHSMKLTLPGYADAERKEIIQNKNEPIKIYFNLISLEENARNEAEIKRVDAAKQAERTEKTARDERERKKEKLRDECKRRVTDKCARECIRGVQYEHYGPTTYEISEACCLPLMAEAGCSKL